MKSIRLLGVALFVGLTISRGALSPMGREIFNLFLAVAALARVMELKRSGQPVRFAWPLLLPIAAGIISLPYAAIPNLAVYPLGEFAMIIVVAGLFAGRAYSGEAIYWVIGGVAFLAGSMILESAAHFRMLGGVGLGLQPGGFIGGASASAVILAATLPLVVRAKLERRLPRSVFIAILVLFSAAFILAGSRTAFIALCAAFVIPFWRLPKNVRLGAAFILLAVLAAGVAVYLPRFVAKLDLDYMTNQQRISMARGVWTALADRPAFGFGTGSFGILGQQYLSFPKWELHPHSLPLRVLFEDGILGLGLWSLMIALGISGLLRPKSHPYAAAIALGFLGGSLTDDLLWIPPAAALFFLAVADRLDQYLVSVPRSAAIGAIGIAFLAASLPLLHLERHDAPLRPISFAIDEAVRRGTTPAYRGWMQDPIARRVAGYQALGAGDTQSAEAHFRRADALDPLMLFAPHKLDLAHLLSASGDSAAAEALVVDVARRAPVLAAWYRGDPDPPGPRSFLDRHYRMEFIDPMRADLSELPYFSDPLDWTLYRRRAADALARGDTAQAIAESRASLYLARLNYGDDPVLYRIIAQARSDSSWIDLARRKSGPAFPWPHLAAVIHRIPPATTGDNSGWWPRRK